MIDLNRSVQSMTYFEELSNDIFYEIFDYLDICHSYQAFYHLNQRFHNLLDFFNLPIKINLSCIAVSAFHYCYEHVIRPNKRKIISLHISNVFIHDLLFSSSDFIQQFIHLEKLSLQHIQSTLLTNLLQQLVTLPNLHSLVVIPIDEIPDKSKLYQLIFDLPVLKYCKLSFQSVQQARPLLSLAPSKPSSIEHLIIHNDSTLDEIVPILTCVPNLHRLFWHKLHRVKNSRPQLQKLPLKYLTNVSLEFENIRFDYFELMIRTLFHHVEILHLTTSYETTFLNANRWEQLISNSMPNLRIFDFEYQDKVHTIDRTRLTCLKLSTLFTSLFWSQHEWFFTHECFLLDNSFTGRIHSADPYRRKYYKLYEKIEVHMDFPCQETNFNTVRHVYIGDQDGMMNNTYYFPNANELSLSGFFNENIKKIMNNLNNILCLTRLTKLYINSDSFFFEKVLYLLQIMPNLHTLEISSTEFFTTDYISIQESELFQYVSNTNKLQNLTITEKCTYHALKLVIKLFPRLEYINTDIDEENFYCSMDLLLSKKNDYYPRYLFSLCFKIVCEDVVSALKNFIQSKQYLNNYAIKLINNKVYLWW